MATIIENISMIYFKGTIYFQNSNKTFQTQNILYMDKKKLRKVRRDGKHFNRLSGFHGHSTCHVVSLLQGTKDS